MRTITTKVYQFSELSEDAKEKAIEEIRNSYYNHNDFAQWAIDDCFLFEPKDTEIRELSKKIGKEYTGILIKNTRKDIYFCAERNWFLDCENAMDVTDEKLFLSWLGISKELQEEDSFYWDIRTPKGRYTSTVIHIDCDNEDFFEEIEKAENKFSEHIDMCLKRIASDIDYRFTDEGIIEDIEANKIEFLSNGKRF
jgi:hypothetical protein